MTIAVMSMAVMPLPFNFNFRLWPFPTTRDLTLNLFYTGSVTAARLNRPIGLGGRTFLLEIILRGGEAFENCKSKVANNDKQFWRYSFREEL